MTLRVRAGIAFLLLLCGALAGPLRAELPSSRLLTIFPPGGQAGTTNQVSVAGGDLDGLAEMRSSHPGITASLKSGDSFTVKIDAAVPPGVYDLRVAGKNGVSNPRAFSVGLLGEILQTPESHDEDKAQNVPLQCTVNGRASEGMVDRYRFTARKGDWLTARCEARQIDSRFEPVVTVSDSTGIEVARDRHAGLLHWRVAADGDFTLSIHDLLYRGGSEYFYRLSLGTFPQIESMFPVAVGEDNVRFVVLGHNLREDSEDAKNRDVPLERLEVRLSPRDPELQRPFTRLPAQAALHLFEYRHRTRRGASPPALIDFPGPNLLVASTTNDAPARAQVVWPPVEVAGEFAPNRKSSWFEFHARKGDVFWLELRSQLLGFPSDPILVIQQTREGRKVGDAFELNDSDENIGGNAFNTKNRDARGRFEAKGEGEYQLQIRDLFTHDQSGPTAGYRLVLRRAIPDFQLAVMPAQPPRPKDSKDFRVSTTVLRQKGTVPLKILAFRRDGFDGGIDLSVENLPKGVTAPAARIGPGQTSGVVWLSAAGETPAWTATIKILGSAEIAGVKTTREARPATLVWNVNDFEKEAVESRTCAECVAGGLTDEQPFRLRAAEEKIWTAQSGAKLSIPLVLEQATNCEFENFKGTPSGEPKLEATEELVIDGKSTNTVFALDLGKHKLAPGTHVFALQGTVKGKRKKPQEANLEFTLYSTPITLQVTETTTNSAAK